jgi:hypothetical protein
MPTRRSATKTSAVLVWTAILILYLAWGSTYLGIRIAVSSIPPFAMAAVRFAIAGAVLLAVVSVVRRGSIARPTLREWRDSFIVGAFLLGGGMGAVAWGEQTVPSGITALMIAMMPVWVAIFGRVFLGERLPPIAAIGIAVGLVGVAILVGPALAVDRSLDPAGVVEVRELIRDLGKGGRTIVLSSHLLAETELVCDHVAVLAKGKLIVQGNIKELLHEKDSFWLGTTDDAAAARLLSALPAVEKVALGEGELVVTAPPERAAEITRALAESGIYVTKLVPIRHTLESFFMEITGTDPTTGRGLS